MEPNRRARATDERARERSRKYERHLFAMSKCEMRNAGRRAEQSLELAFARIRECNTVARWPVVAGALRGRRGVATLDISRPARRFSD